MVSHWRQALRTQDPKSLGVCGPFSRVRSLTNDLDNLFDLAHEREDVSRDIQRDLKPYSELLERLGTAMRLSGEKDARSALEHSFPLALIPVVAASPINCTVSTSVTAGVLTAPAACGNVLVNVYDVSISVGGSYYTGSADSVLAVYDPSLGFVTGGGKLVHGFRPTSGPTPST